MASAAFNTRRSTDDPDHAVGHHAPDHLWGDLSPADQELLERAAARIRLRGGPPATPPVWATPGRDRSDDRGLDEIRSAA